MSHILAAGAARMKLEAENYEARIAALEAQLTKLAAENERLRQELASHPRATNTVDAHETANASYKPATYPSASAAEIDPDGAFERAFAEVAGVQLTEPTPPEGQQEPVGFIRALATKEEGDD